MSWSFSRALVEEYSGQCSLGIEPSAPLSSTPSPDQFYWPDKPTEHSRLSRFGMTCEPLMDDLGAGLLTWFLAASRVRICQSPEKAPDLMASVADCGEKWRGSLARYDPASHSLKTAQLSLLEDLTGCFVTLPRSGLMRDGECSELPMLAHRTSANESGYWATPAASDGTRGGTITDKMTGQSLVQMVNTPAKWPTPTAGDHTGPGHAAQGGMNLRTAVALWPTPTVCGNYNRKGASASSGDGLATAVLTWPTATATATAYKGWSPNHNRADTDDRLDYSVERESFVNGQATPPMRLNPNWVEWLMGWPIGHTELRPLETGRFREFERLHGGF